MDRILILGSSGLVGEALANELSKKYEVYGTYNSNKIASIKSIYFNISEVYKIIDILNKVKPLKIVYCLRGDFNFQIELLHELVKYLNLIKGKLYFCSTANVFDGDTTIPHLKNHEPIAESDYGKFKIECEKILKKDLGDNCIIFRLPMIWGKNSPRLNGLVTALNNNEKIDIYTNLYLNNNTDIMLAKQISYIIENDLKGIFHLGSNEVINYYEFIKKIISNFGYNYTNFNEQEISTEKHYFAVLPTAGDLPKEFNFSNEDLICYLSS
jgi:dTDP-4-dehydrorhamnose reductase